MPHIADGVLRTLPWVVAFFVFKPLAALTTIWMVRYAIDLVIGLATLVANTKDDVLARFGTVFVTRS